MARKHHPPKPLELNLTSMMDIVFQLIIFFILVTNFAAAKLPPIEMPDPLKSKAQAPENVKKVIVNVVAERQKQNINGKIMDLATGDITKLVVDGIEYKPGTYGFHNFAQNPNATMVTVNKMCKKVTDQLKVEKIKADVNGVQFEVVLRADKGVYFDLVAPVMQSITSAGIVNVNMTAKLDKKR